MNRNTDNAVFRNAAVTWGIAPHRTGDVSFPRSVSRIQCDLFSIDQCPRRKDSKRSADASSRGSLVILSNELRDYRCHNSKQFSFNFKFHYRCSICYHFQHLDLSPSPSQNRLLLHLVVPEILLQVPGQNRLWHTQGQVGGQYQNLLSRR